MTDFVSGYQTSGDVTRTLLGPTLKHYGSSEIDAEDPAFFSSPTGALSQMVHLS